MEIELKVKTKYEVKYLSAFVGARYWEDSTVNGIEDEDGTLIPCRNGDNWCPLIDLETGQIINWKTGTVAHIHYKSCDQNVFKLLSPSQEVVAEIDGYVIDMMSPEEEGFGDYVIMSIDENGFIKDFKADLTPFLDDED